MHIYTAHEQAVIRTTAPTPKTFHEEAKQGLPVFHKM